MSGSGEFRAGVLSVLRQMQERGEEFLFLPRTAAGLEPARLAVAAPETESGPAALAQAGAKPGPGSPAVRPDAPAERQLQGGPPGQSLEEFGRRISGCTLCRLHQSRTNFVFGSGDPDADLLFVGEGPGAEEDRQGLPFVGASGQLLTKIIAAIGFRREEIYIANLVKCRPPGNRDPQEDEIAACNPYLLRQIEMIRPKVIVTLGRHSAYYFHGLQDSMRALRGKVVDFNGIKVVSTYHPAALLRNPAYKRDTWEDMLLARKVYDEQGGRPSSGAVFQSGDKG